MLSSADCAKLTTAAAAAAAAVDAAVDALQWNDGRPVYCRFPSSPDVVCSSSDMTDDAESTRSADETSTGVICSTSSLAAKRYDCARCDKRFASAATLAKHLQVCTDILLQKNISVSGVFGSCQTDVSFSPEILLFNFVSFFHNTVYV